MIALPNSLSHEKCKQFKYQPEVPIIRKKFLPIDAKYTTSRKPNRFF